MTSVISRRAVAAGLAWAVPSLAVAAAAPAMAASPCAGVVRGQPLPASAFQVTYIAVTNETLGGVADKQVAVDFGLKVNCGVTGAIRSTDGNLTSRFTLSNGTKYSGTNGGSVPANGSAGVIDTSCRSGLNGTQACGTTGQSPYDLAGSKKMSGSHVTAVSIARTITVAGYGTTVLYLNGSGFGATQSSNNLATSLSVSATPAI